MYKPNLEDYINRNFPLADDALKNRFRSIHKSLLTVPKDLSSTALPLLANLYNTTRDKLRQSHIDKLSELMFLAER